MDREEFRELIRVLKDIKEAILLNTPIEDDLENINDIRSALHHQLEAKTGWRRNEVKNIFEVAVKSVIK